jgi:hypothetical protein
MDSDLGELRSVLERVMQSGQPASQVVLMARIEIKEGARFGDADRIRLGVDLALNGRDEFSSKVVSKWLAASPEAIVTEARRLI